MMGDGEALRVAVDLLHVPSRVRMIRVEPLPHGVPLLLRIAAGDVTAETEAVRLADRPPDVIRAAAAFFIEQILLCPEADSYRVLGAGQEATSSELRQNMALLMRWLHPDKVRQAQQSVFINRVTMAWDNLKTAERRAAYDRQYWALKQKTPVRGHRGAAHGRSAEPGSRRNPALRRRDGLLQRVLLFLLGASRR
jgi:DnaJ-like protein